MKKLIKDSQTKKKVFNLSLTSILLILVAIILFDDISFIFAGIALILIGFILLYLVNQND